MTAESWCGRAAGIDGPTWVMATYIYIADCTRYIPYAFVLSHAVRCWCTQGSSILLLWCGACAFMFGHAVCCWCPQGSSVPLVSLWCRCCGVSQVMRMQALHVQGHQRWCWLRACPGSAAKQAQCQLVYLPDCASVADACQSACQHLIVVAALQVDSEAVLALSRQPCLFVEEVCVVSL